jgi:hypothetical protein
MIRVGSYWKPSGAIVRVRREKVEPRGEKWKEDSTEKTTLERYNNHLERSD